MNTDPLARSQVLRDADNLICGDRNAAYGDPLKDFTRTAEMWSAILGIYVPPHKVAMCQIALKLSRMFWDPTNRDHVVDMCGYGALAWECIDRELSVSSTNTLKERGSS